MGVHCEEVDSCLSLLVMFAVSCEPVTGTAGNKALEEIVVLEKQGWEAIRKKHWNTLSSLVAEKFVGVGEMGIRGKSERYKIAIGGSMGTGPS